MNNEEKIQEQINFYEDVKRQFKENPERMSEIIAANAPKETIYEHMREATKYKGSDIAQTFRVITGVSKNGQIKTTRNREVTYDEFHDSIANFGKMLTSMGLYKGDRLALLLPNLPESTDIIYGANKVGVVSDNIDPTSSPENLKFFFKNEKVNAIVCFDALYNETIKPIEHFIKDELKIDTIIVVSIKDSLIFPEKQLLTLADKAKERKGKKEPLKSDVLKLISLSEALRNSKYEMAINAAFEPDQLACICHSSGTTGLPKAIPATNENVNFIHYQHMIADIPYQRIKSSLHVLPAFAQFGFTDSMHLWHCWGNNVIEVPVFSHEQFGDLLNEYKPNSVWGVPSWWMGLITNPKYKDIDLSFLVEAVCGGDRLTISQMQDINEFLVQHGARCLVRIGYGMSEFSGTCMLSDNYRTPLDSCGKSLPGGEGKIMNLETMSECAPNVEGILCYHKESMPPKEFDGKELYHHININGEDYLNTSDVFSKDEEGNFYFRSRSTGMISRYDGYKVYPSVIENCITKNPLVKDCMISSYYESSKYGNMPFIHLVLEKELDDTELSLLIEDIINNYILKDPGLCFRAIPSRWKVKDELYITHGLKRDYKKMETEGLDGTEISVICDETNLGLDGFKIVFPTKEKVDVKILKPIKNN